MSKTVLYRCRFWGGILMPFGFTAALVACTTHVDVDYNRVCTKADALALSECSAKSNADPIDAERICRDRICTTKEPWLRHREYGGGCVTDESYEVRCADATKEEDRKLCETAGYVYGQTQPVSTEVFARSDP